LYAQNGYDKSTIALLFTVGFATSATFGTFIGSSADQYGRKKLAVLFGVLYSLSCVTKHFTDFRIAVAGRVLSGVSTSILHSAFESWMVSAHHQVCLSTILLHDFYLLLLHSPIFAGWIPQRLVGGHFLAGHNLQWTGRCMFCLLSHFADTQFIFLMFSTDRCRCIR
jgi:MFS family permease